ncbi:MAG: dockerin type I repeat-containing protein [Oscillospiraceae bacterium]|nr:dockerin type I repeat-containing protein [Oscillospiraceae bacterium]
MKTKLLALLMVFCLALSVAPTVLAAETPAVSVSLATGEAADFSDGEAGTLILAVNIENNPGISSLDVSLGLPDGWSITVKPSSTVGYGLTYTTTNPYDSSERCILYMQGFNLQANVSTNRIAGANGNNVSGDGVLFWVSVDVPAETESGDYTVSLKINEISTTDESSTSINATQNIASSFTGAGDYTITVSGVAPSSGGGTSGDTSGGGTSGGGSSGADVPGDLNGDGEVDASDLTILARHVGKVDTITDETALANADVTADGDVDASDLTKLAQYVGKIISSLD